METSYKYGINKFTAAGLLTTYVKMKSKNVGVGFVYGFSSGNQSNSKTWGSRAAAALATYCLTALSFTSNMKVKSLIYKHKKNFII